MSATGEAARAAVGVGMALMLVVGSPALTCEGSEGREVFIGYPGPPRPEEEIATLRLGGAESVMIDRNGIYLTSFYDRIELLPGEHHIAWSKTFPVSIMVNPEMSDTLTRSETFRLEPSHTYLVEAARSHGPGYRLFLWIEDVTSGEIVAGEKKPSRMTEAQKARAAERGKSGR